MEQSPCLCLHYADFERVSTLCMEWGNQVQTLGSELPRADIRIRSIDPTVSHIHMGHCFMRCYNPPVYA
jgi:hypothetical protein